MTHTAAAIQAKDLKVGNWLQVKKFEKFNLLTDPVLVSDALVPVYSIHDEIGINVWAGDDGMYSEYFLSDLQGIPLTPEILEKCGFKKHTNQYGTEYTLDHPFFNIAQIEWIKDHCCVIFEGTQTGIDIKYVHQLQNLYFALIGEELEVNL